MGDNKLLESFMNDPRHRQFATYARWCWTDTFSLTGPDSDWWKNDIPRPDLQMVAEVFNAFETYEILVISELLDLQTTADGSTNVSVFTESALQDPASIIAGSESASRLAEAIDLDEDLNKHLMKGSQMTGGTALFNEKELQFLSGNNPDHTLFRGQSGKCLEWVREQSNFCGENAVGNSDRCVQHRDTGELEIISSSKLDVRSNL